MYTLSWEAICDMSHHVFSFKNRFIDSKKLLANIKSDLIVKNMSYPKFKQTNFPKLQSIPVNSK